MFYCMEKEESKCMARGPLSSPFPSSCPFSFPLHFRLATQSALKGRGRGGGSLCLSFFLLFPASLGACRARGIAWRPLSAFLARFLDRLSPLCHFQAPVGALTLFIFRLSRLHTGHTNLVNSEPQISFAHWASVAQMGSCCEDARSTAPSRPTPTPWAASSCRVKRQRGALGSPEGTKNAKVFFHPSPPSVRLVA